MNAQWDFGAVWSNTVVDSGDDDDADFDPSLPCKWIPDVNDDDTALTVPPPPAGLFVGLTLTGVDGEVLETTGLMVGESVRRILTSVAELFFWTAMCVLLGIVVFALVARLPHSAFERVVMRGREEEEEEEEEEVNTPETTPGPIVHAMAVVHGGKPSAGQLLHYFKPETVAATMVRRVARKQECPVRVTNVSQYVEEKEKEKEEEEEEEVEVEMEAEAEVGDKRGACDEGGETRETKVARVEGVEGEGVGMAI